MLLDDLTSIEDVSCAACGLLPRRVTKWRDVDAITSDLKRVDDFRTPVVMMYSKAEDESTAYVRNPADAYKSVLKLLQPTQDLGQGHHNARFDEDITSTISSIEDDIVEDEDDDAPPVEGLGDKPDIRPQDTAPIDNIVTDPRHVPTHPARPRGLATSATPDRSMGMFSPNDVHSWAIRRGVQPERVQIMQASLFGAQAPAQPPTGPARPDIMPAASRKHSREMSQQVDPPVAVAENAGAH
ncbi:hypothetical protein OC846_006454, partial [Tilletia horrida]